jgi:hypothetical protein
MYVEVWAQCDLFGVSGDRGGAKMMPKEMPLRAFLQKEDPGYTLLRCLDALEQNLKENFPWVQVQDCLNADPGHRPTIKAFINELYPNQGPVSQ